MSYIDDGFNNNLIKDSGIPSSNTDNDNSSNQSGVPGSYISGGISKSTNGKLLVDWNTGTVTVNDGARVRVELGYLPSTDGYGIKIYDASGNVLLTADGLADGTVTVDMLDVDELSAISANLGTVTAGSMSGVTMSIGSLNSIFKADANGIYLGNATFASAPFRVSMAGALVATSATITGAIQSGSTITGSTVTGGTIQTASSGQRVMMDGSSNQLKIYNDDGLVGGLYGSTSGGQAVLYMYSDTNKDILINATDDVSLTAGDDITLLPTGDLQLVGSSDAYLAPDGVVYIDGSSIEVTSNLDMNGYTITGSITGSAGSATTATNVSGGSVSATTGSFSSWGSFGGDIDLNGNDLNEISELKFNDTSSNHNNDTWEIWGYNSTEKGFRCRVNGSLYQFDLTSK